MVGLHVIEYLLRVPWVWRFPWGFQWGMGWVWGLKCHPHGSPVKFTTSSILLPLDRGGTCGWLLQYLEWEVYGDVMTRAHSSISSSNASELSGSDLHGAGRPTTTSCQWSSCVHRGRHRVCAGQRLPQYDADSVSRQFSRVLVPPSPAASPTTAVRPSLRPVNAAPRHRSASASEETTFQLTQNNRVPALLYGLPHEQVSLEIAWFCPLSVLREIMFRTSNVTIFRQCQKLFDCELAKCYFRKKMQ